MQMRRWQYEPINKRLRAAEYRRAAMECEAAGYSEMAALNNEMAAALNPPPRTPREVTRGKRPSKGPDHTRIDGRRDAAPRRVA